MAGGDRLFCLVLVTCVSVCLLLNRAQGVEVSVEEIEELRRELKETTQSLNQIVSRLQELTELGGLEEERATDEKETGDEKDISCMSILQRTPSAPSGLYHIQGATGKEVEVYCDMTRECCGHGEKGWARIGYLNMSDPFHSCPEGFKEVDGSSRGCKKASRKTTCSSMIFANPDKIQFSKVCGTVAAGQHNNPDGFIREGEMAGWEYDGISVHLRQSNIYLVVLGAPGEQYESWFTCPCKALDDPMQATLMTFATDLSPSKFCPSGVNQGSCPAKINCCAAGGLPPFCITLPEVTTDDLELRVCLDQDESDEDISVQQVELLVQ